MTGIVGKTEAQAYIDRIISKAEETAEKKIVEKVAQEIADKVLFENEPRINNHITQVASQLGQNLKRLLPL